jgi:gamma-glutamyltranspeptidase/glutathione hydrolase
MRRRDLGLLTGACLLAAPLLSAAAVAADGPAVATQDMAATANPLATQAALEILREGGTAVDAAVAAQMVLAVVEPQSSGLGGGSLLVVWDRRGGDVLGYEGLAGAPAGVPQDYAHLDGRAIEPKVLDRSGRVVGVPGTVRVLARAHARHGHLPWARLFRAAIATAEGGFAMPRYLNLILHERPELARKPEFAAYFDATGAPLPVGTRLTNPVLATTLRVVADKGEDALYTGTIAADIAAAVAAPPLPGTLTTADLAAYAPHERAPVCVIAFAHRICSAAPPSSGGVALLEQLAMLDALNIGATRPGSLEAAHLLLETSLLAAADRRAYLGDPDQMAVSPEAMLDKEYIARRAAEVGARAIAHVAPGQIAKRHSALPESDPVALPATTHLSIVDAAGDVVSFTTTINLNFGADLIVDGMVLNDGLTNFAANPVISGIRGPNAAAPGRLPATTMAPTIVFDLDSRPVLVVGAGGGARIIDSVAQTIVGVLAWHQDVRTAIEQPRIGGENRAEELERGTPAADLAEGLRAMGHDPKIVVMNAAVQAIEITPQGLHGWADPRRDGVAAGD